MPETQENNSFIEAMNAEKPQSAPKTETAETESVEKYAVSPAAESIVNTLANIPRVVGIVAGVVGCCLWIYLLFDYETAAAWAALVGGIVVLLNGLILWAFLKVFVNISRSLYNINDALKVLKKKKD